MEFQPRVCGREREGNQVCGLSRRAEGLVEEEPRQENRRLTRMRNRAGISRLIRRKPPSRNRPQNPIETPCDPSEFATRKPVLIRCSAEHGTGLRAPPVGAAARTKERSGFQGPEPAGYRGKIGNARAENCRSPHQHYIPRSAVGT